MIEGPVPEPVEAQQQLSTWWRWCIGLAWVWLGVVMLVALLLGVASDACESSGCDTRVGTAWIVLMVGQAGVWIAALRTGRSGLRTRLLALAAGAVAAPLLVVGYLVFVTGFA